MIDHAQLAGALAATAQAMLKQSLLEGAWPGAPVVLADYSALSHSLDLEGLQPLLDVLLKGLAPDRPLVLLGRRGGGAWCQALLETVAILANHAQGARGRLMGGQLVGSAEEELWQKDSVHLGWVALSVAEAARAEFFLTKRAGELAPGGRLLMTWPAKAPPIAPPVPPALRLVEYFGTGGCIVALYVKEPFTG
ncbi:hypothetical protein E3E12_02935 [Formicincola oecophyllae]|uniref:Uncharacterized protein n=1 Tax=Formicincola oecophyllae TaxID=2558361 RepID=A0A4Y6U9T5_9PROT|nr:hypothetical protein [Formicincola oecophyllae]QDH13328.1 hypothetical protein E3E12_02935 [Formicincola oecophyllae]